MKVVYVAGPFTGKSSWDIEGNVRRAEGLALEVAKLGAMPLCPHTNTRFFHGTITNEFWYDGTLELMRRADAIILIEGWQGSHGTGRELEEAKKKGIPVFEHLNKLASWLGNTSVVPEPIDNRTMRDFHYVVLGRLKAEKKFDIRRTLGDIADEILDDVPFVKDDVGSLSSWEIRDGSGHLLDHSLHFGEVDLVGRVFFISPRAGVSG
jgi:hypothetical protein